MKPMPETDDNDMYGDDKPKPQGTQSPDEALTELDAKSSAEGVKRTAEMLPLPQGSTGDLQILGRALDDFYVAAADGQGPDMGPLSDPKGLTEAGRAMLAACAAALANTPYRFDTTDMNAADVANKVVGAMNDKKVMASVRGGPKPTAAPTKEPPAPAEPEPTEPKAGEEQADEDDMYGS